MGVLLKVPLIIIIRFGENNVLIIIYVRGGSMGGYNFGGFAGVYGSTYIFLFIIHIKGKITDIKIKFYIFLI